MTFRWSFITLALTLSVSGVVVAEQVTAVPQLSAAPFDRGSDSIFLNGSILAPALSALHNVDAKGINVDNGARMSMKSDGTLFVIGEPNSARTIRAALAGSTFAVSENTEKLQGNGVVQVEIAPLRALGHAYDVFSGIKYSQITDLSLPNYDVLVERQAVGKHAGDYVVEFLHHKDSAKKETIIGCRDSSGGYNASFFVTPGTWVVTKKPCS